MPCDHLGPPEIIQMVENHLRAKNIDPGNWAEMRFRHGENVIGGMWASVVIEIERRGDEWIVTRLDRNRDPIPERETGLSERVKSEDESVKGEE